MPELDIKSSTLEKGLGLVKGFLEKAIGPSIEELGMTWSDSMRQRRVRNQLKAFQKMKQLAEDSHIEVRQINLKALFPLLEGIAVEEDETLQDMWAKLFVNYIDSKRNMTIHVYPDILKQLSTNEIKILQYMDINFKLFVKEFPNPPKQVAFTIEEIANLKRLGLIEEEGHFSLYDGGKQIEELAPIAVYISNFGVHFLDACR